LNLHNFLNHFFAVGFGFILVQYIILNKRYNLKRKHHKNCLERINELELKLEDNNVPIYEFDGDEYYE
jgi:hypothetical protein